MPLEIVGAGFGRTGTVSIQKAIDILYEQEEQQKGEKKKRCYHFLEILARPHHVDQWIKILETSIESKKKQQEGKKGDTTNIDWEQLFNSSDDDTEFVATMDHPCCDFYQPLLQKYPNAKVILSNHPGGMQKWYDSKLGHQEFLECFLTWPIKPFIKIAMPIMGKLLFDPKGERKGKSNGQQQLSIESIQRLIEVTEINAWGSYPDGIHNADHVFKHYEK